MNNSIIRLLIISVFVLTFQRGVTQNMKEADAWKYMHMLSADEMNRRDEIGKYFQATPPPPQPVQSIAEFEPMSGVLVHANYINPLKNLIADFAKTDTVYIMVHYNSEIAPLMNYLNNLGIEISKCKFFQNYYVTGWLRDEGPMFVAGEDSVRIIGFMYNNSNRIFPEYIATKCNYPYSYMNMIHTGGNYMTDGYGVAASTQIVYTKNPVPQKEIDQKMKDYLGIHTYHVLQDPNFPNTINHIDCWGKFLDVDKILIRSVPESHPRYPEIEAIASYFKNQKSSWGNNYQVIRIYTPNDEPYTDSFILNKRVFVPIMGNEWDEPALDVYKKAMPGYQVSGYLGPWSSVAALHCTVHEVADKQMVRIQHIPIRGAQGDKTEFKFEATIKAYSGKPLKSDSVLVFYKTDFGLWKSAKMQHTDGDTYLAQLPAFNKNQVVQYYIYAADQAGKRATLPIIGAAAPFAFATSDVYTGIKPTVTSCETKVYPNPVCDWLCISFGENNFSEIISTDILSFTGKVLNVIPKVSSDKLFVDFSNFDSGIYIVRINRKNVVETHKIIKQ